MSPDPHISLTAQNAELGTGPGKYDVVGFRAPAKSPPGRPHGDHTVGISPSTSTSQNERADVRISHRRSRLLARARVRLDTRDARGEALAPIRSSFHNDSADNTRTSETVGSTREYLCERWCQLVYCSGLHKRALERK